MMTMKEFALNILKEQRVVNANALAYRWFEYKNDGRYPPAASRARFGTTSAAYRTARKLRAEGLIEFNDRSCDLVLIQSGS